MYAATFAASAPVQVPGASSGIDLAMYLVSCFERAIADERLRMRLGPFACLAMTACTFLLIDGSADRLVGEPLLAREDLAQRVSKPLSRRDNAATWM